MAVIESPAYGVYKTYKNPETQKPELRGLVKVFDDKEKAKEHALRLRKNRDAEQRRHGDNFAVKKVSAESAMEQKQKEKKERMTQGIMDEAQARGPEVFALVQALFRDNNFSYAQIWDFDVDRLQYTTEDSEYISTRNRASVRSTTVSGSIEIDGDYFRAEKVPVHSTTNRV